MTVPPFTVTTTLPAELRLGNVQSVPDAAAALHDVQQYINQLAASATLLLEEPSGTAGPAVLLRKTDNSWAQMKLTAGAGVSIAYDYALHEIQIAVSQTLVEVETLTASVSVISPSFVGNLTGNADTVTNGVYTTGSYADPSWITSLDGSKITGLVVPSMPFSNITFSGLTPGHVLRALAPTVAAFGSLELANPVAVTGVLPNANTTATSLNTADTIVARGASGEFAAGLINGQTLTSAASLTGSLAVATTLSVGGNTTLGDATGDTATVTGTLRSQYRANFYVSGATDPRSGSNSWGSSIAAISSALVAFGTTSSERAMLFLHAEASNEGPLLFLGKTRGTNPGVLSAVLTGDNLGTLSMRGAATSTVALEGFRLNARVNGTVSATSLPTDVYVATHNGSTLADKWVWRAAGAFEPVTTNSYALGAAAARVSTGYFGTMLDVEGTTALPLQMSRTGSSSNVAIRMFNITNGVYFGLDANEAFAVANGNDLTASPWLTLTSALLTTNAITANGTLTKTGAGTVTLNPTTAGTLNNIVIGGTTPLAGAFTTLAGTLTTASQPNVTTMTALVSVGTITTGTWNATAIANAYIATGLDVAKLTVGTTLPSNVVTSSLTTIGTLVAGAVPASLVTAGTFGAGAYTFPSTLAAATLTLAGGATTNALSVTTTGATTSTFRYNSSNRLDLAVSSTGVVLYTAAGSGALHRFANDVRLNGGLAIGAGAASNVAVYNQRVMTASAGSATAYWSAPTYTTAANNDILIGFLTNTTASISNSGAFTNVRYRHVWLRGPGTVTGTLAEQVGLYIDSLTQASTNIAIQTGAGRIVFGDAVAVGGATWSATTALIAPASTTGVSSARLLPGVAPSAPVDGDLWLTTETLFSRINGASRGFVAGPASVTDNTIARYDGTNGKLVQASSIVISDNDDVSAIRDLSITRDGFIPRVFRQTLQTTVPGSSPHAVNAANGSVHVLDVLIDPLVITLTGGTDGQLLEVTAYASAGTTFGDVTITVGSSSYLLITTGAAPGTYGTILLRKLNAGWVVVGLQADLLI